MFRVVRGLQFYPSRFFQYGRRNGTDSTLPRSYVGHPFNHLGYIVTSPITRSGFTYNGNPDWAFHTYLNLSDTVSFDDTYVDYEPLEFSDTVSFDDIFDDSVPNQGKGFKAEKRYNTFKTKRGNTFKTLHRTDTLKAVQRVNTFKALNRAEP